VISADMHESLWVAAVYRDDSPRPLGTGVVIDSRRVMTCAHVCSGLIGGNGEPEVPLWIDFPKIGAASLGSRGDGPRTRRCRVVGARLSDECDLAVLYLEGAVPAGVKAARLRRPLPDHLRGRNWWAFGFPASQDPGSFPGGRVPGNGADGMIGEILGDGLVRLDTSSRYGVEAGFSGGGLWSPDYEAVVGIVTASNGTDALAVTLHQADQCFSEEGLSALTGWSADQAGEVALSSWGWSLEDDPEYGPHWEPRARGVWAMGEEAYRFRGRTAALTAIIAWLGRERTDPRALVVTGAPGAGKSAVLGRVVTTADPRISAVLPADDAVRAMAGSVACAVHAKGKTALEVAQEIARTASAALPDKPAKLAPAMRGALADYGIRRFNVVIDALDEAVTPEQTRLIVHEVVMPLLQQCSGAQAVIGSRPKNTAGSLIGAFGDDVVVVDLDAVDYFRLEDLEAYTLATLQQSGADRPGNPYADERVARPLAERIARLSGRNFLVACLIARTHGLYDDEPAGPGHLTYTSNVGIAFRGYLERMPDEEAVAGIAAEELLTALAYAEAPGLLIDLWITAVEALYGVRPGKRELRKFAQSSAANFLVESGQRHEAYRLFHQALNDTLLKAREGYAAEDQAALTSAFLSYGRQVGWKSAPLYLLQSLAYHARAAEMIDELLADDEYLLHADLRRLTPQAAYAATVAGKQRAQLLRLTPYAASASPAERKALFSVTETLEKLGESFRGAPGPAPYRARWATVTTHQERAGQVGHTGGVLSVCAFVLDGQPLLASAGEDEMVRIWDPLTAQQVRVLEGHSGAVRAVCPVASGEHVLLASAGSDSTVVVWDPATGQQQRILEGHTAPVSSVCGFSCEEGRTLLASVGGDEVVRVWDPLTGRQVQVLEGHSGAVNAVCGFRSGGQTLLAAGSADMTVAVWDPLTGQRLRVLEGHSGAVQAVCSVTSGERVLLASAGSDSTVAVWDPVTGQRLRVMEGHVAGSVWAVCGFSSADGHALLASAGDDGMVRVWDPATGQQQLAIDGHTGEVQSVCSFTGGDGRPLLAIGSVGPVVAVWDPLTGQRVRVMEGHVAGSVWAVCGFSSADGHALLASAGDDGMVRVWDPATGQQQLAIDGNTGDIRSLSAFTGDDGQPLLASAGRGSTIRISDPATGELRQAIECGSDDLGSVCAFTGDDGRALLAAGSNDSMIRIFDLATGECQRTLDGHTGAIWSIHGFTSDDGRTLLASAADDEAVRVWDPATGELRQTLPGHTGGAWWICAFISADGRTKLATASADTTVRVWDPLTGELRHTMKGHTAGVWSVCAFLSGSRTLLASCAYDAVRVWDAETAQALYTIPVHLMPHDVKEIEGLLVLGLSSGLLAIQLDREAHQNPDRVSPPSE
jgi:WD40 repeat protein